MNMKEDETIVWGLEGRSSEFMIYDFSQVLEATTNFSEENKLGQGGFGPVYKVRVGTTSSSTLQHVPGHLWELVGYRDPFQILPSHP